MKAWPDFEASAPDIAGLGRKLLSSGGKAIESAFGVIYQPGTDGLAVPTCRRWRAEAAAA